MLVEPERGLSRRLAHALESGRVPASAAALGLARAWGAIARRTVARPLALPAGVRIVAVGGATLGGSGKTPLAIACALAYAARGERVAIVGHAYRARPRAARVVAVTDALEEVGDEALVCARALAGVEAACVVVAPTRQRALDFAASRADRVVLDGVAQTSPKRADVALLAVDGAAPWGAGALPPLGDLRAPRDALEAACDAVVRIVDPLAAPPAVDGALCAEIASRGVQIGEELIPWRAVASLEVGLVTALARPDRLARFLSLRGVVPRMALHGPDHRAPPFASAAAPALWLASEKCRTHLPAVLGGAPVATIDYSVDTAFVSELDRRSP